MKPIIIISLLITSILFASKKDSETLLGEIITETELENNEHKEFNKQKKDNHKKSKNLKEILQEFSSVHFNIGSRGEAFFNIRGFTNREIPILINGIPVYMPYSGSMDLFKIKTGLIDEVKLITGLSSVLYGPNTMGGAINIVTKTPSKGLHFEIKSEFNTYSYDLNIDMSYSVKNYYIALYNQVWDSDGYKTNKNGEDKIINQTLREDKDLRYNSQKAGHSTLLKIGYKNRNDKTEISFLNLNENRGMPVELNNPGARYWKFPIWQKNNITLINQKKINENLNIKTRFFYDSYYNQLKGYRDINFEKLKFDSIYDDFSYGFVSNPKFTFFETDSIEFSLYYKHDIHREGEEKIPLSEYEKYSMDTFSIASEYKKEFEDLTLKTGVSYDINTTNTKDNKLKRINAVNPQISLNYWINDNYTLKVSVGQKTRFPTLKELFSGYIDRNVPNPDLKEEKAIHYQLFLDYQKENFSLRGELFYTDTNDTIMNKTIDPVNRIQKLENIGKSHITGLELLFNTEKLYKYFNISASYTYQYSHSDNLKDNILPYTPENLFKLSLLTSLSYNTFINTTFLYTGKQYEFTKSNDYIEIPSYKLININIENNYQKNLTFYFKINNLLNSYIYTQQNFPLAGREFYLGVKYSF